MSAMTAGALASFMACPVEVCLVRMQVRQTQIRAVCIWPCHLTHQSMPMHQ